MSSTAIRGADQIEERVFIHNATWNEFDMTHAFSIAFKDVVGVIQTRAVEKADARVAAERIHIAERRVADAGYRASVVQQLPHIRPAASHVLEPWANDEPERIGNVFKPRFDTWVSSNRS